MADTKKMNKQNEMNKSKTETMQRESGQSGSRERGSEREQGGIRSEEREKSAIGGGQSTGQSRTGQSREFAKDKSRSEPTSR